MLPALLRSVKNTYITDASSLVGRVMMGIFLETLFDVCARVRLVPRNMSTKTARDKKHK